MAITIEIPVPWDDITVILPPSDAITKLINGDVSIFIENATNENLSISSVGSSASFTVDLPADPIYSSTTETVALTFLANGDLDFEQDINLETITITEGTPAAEVFFDIDYFGAKKAIRFDGFSILIIDDASSGNLEPVGTDFLFTCWFRLTDDIAEMVIFSKYDAFNQKSYRLWHDETADRIKWSCSSNGTATTDLSSDVLGVPSINVWYFAEAGVVGGNMTLRVTPKSSGSRNSANTTAFVGSIFNSAGGNSFVIGGQTNFGGANARLYGDVDELLYFYSSIPSNGNLDSIFNGGNGRNRRYIENDLSLTPDTAWSLEGPFGVSALVSWDGTKTLNEYNNALTLVDGAVNTSFISIDQFATHVNDNFDQSGPWTARCRSGGDLLGNNISFIGNGLSNAPIKITAYTGEEHEGDVAAGAFCSAVVISGNYYTVEKLRCTGSITATCIDVAINNIIFRKNLFTTAGIALTAIGSAQETSIADVVVENNLMFPTPGLSGIAISTSSGGAECLITNCVIQNNTIIGFGNSDYGININVPNAGFATTFDALIYNNAIYNSASGCIVVVPATNHTVTFDQNATSDMTGDITGLLDTDFVDYAMGDYYPADTGVLYKSGVSNSLLEDILGDPREGLLPDIGALETAYVGPITTNSIENTQNFGSPKINHTIYINSLVNTQTFDSPTISIQTFTNTIPQNCKIELLTTQDGQLNYKITVTIYDIVGKLQEQTGADAAAASLRTVALSRLKNGETFYIIREEVYDYISHKRIRNFLYDLTGSVHQDRLNILYKLHSKGKTNPVINFFFEI